VTAQSGRVLLMLAMQASASRFMEELALQARRSASIPI
jgi:hypothetical protein